MLSWTPDPADPHSKFITLKDANWHTFDDTTLYKRHFYDAFYEGVLEEFPLKKKVILRGTAGIGLFI